MPIHSLNPKIDDLKVGYFTPIDGDKTQLSSSTVTPGGQIISVSFYDRHQNTITSMTNGPNGPIYTTQFINDKANAGRVRTPQPAKPDPEGLESAVKAEIADMAKHPELAKARKNAEKLLEALKDPATDVPYVEPADFNKAMASNFKQAGAMQYGAGLHAKWVKMKARHGACPTDAALTDKTMISVLQAEGVLPLKTTVKAPKAPGCNS
jgi:hypothetical protein